MKATVPKAGDLQAANFNRAFLVHINYLLEHAPLVPADPGHGVHVGQHLVVLVLDSHHDAVAAQVRAARLKTVAGPAPDNIKLRSRFKA